MVTGSRKPAGPRQAREHSLPCWLWLRCDAPMHAVRFDSISSARRRFDRIASFLAGHGASVEATIHFGDTRDEATSSPPVKRLIAQAGQQGPLP